ncbi:SPOR domain-containing protein [Solidesulfovibrio magneticus]|nr:SPOR domain-containing protein [Solidesulfovibrio magneticus]
MSMRPLACLLAALCLGLSSGYARAGTDASPAVTALVCGALLRDTVPGEGWPAARDVRLGEAVGAADRGLGCRFVVSGEAGQAPVVVAVRLTRPLPEGGTAQDIWQAAARPGEPAVAAYALVAGLPVAAGEWTLTLIPPGGQPAVARFQVAGRPAEAAASPPAAMPTAPGAKAAVKAAAAAPRPEPALPVAAPQTPPAAPQAAPALPALAAAPVAPAEPGDQTARPVVPTAAQTTTPAAAPAGQANTSAPPSPPPGPAKAEPRPKTPPSPKAEPAAGYLALQTGLFADADNAAAQAAKLRAQGLPACLAMSDKDGKRRYRVLAGRFGDRRAAAAARAEVMAATGVAPLVTPVAASDIPRLRCR